MSGCLTWSLRFTFVFICILLHVAIAVNKTKTFCSAFVSGFNWIQFVLCVNELTQSRRNRIPWTHVHSIKSFYRATMVDECETYYVIKQNDSWIKHYPVIEIFSGLVKTMSSAYRETVYSLGWIKIFAKITGSFTFDNRIFYLRDSFLISAGWFRSPGLPSLMFTWVKVSPFLISFNFDAPSN